MKPNTVVIFMMHYSAVTKLIHETITDAVQNFYNTAFGRLRMLCNNLNVK